MRITIVLAVLVLTSSLFLSAGCNLILAQNSDDLVSSVTDPGAVDIGTSLINPDSPLYFLKTLREKIETILSGSDEIKLNRELEFAQRRLREVKSLVENKKQDPVVTVINKYNMHMDRVNKLAVSDSGLQASVAEAVARHLDVLQRVYDTVGNPQAKNAILAAIERSEEHNRDLLGKLEIVTQQKLIKKIASRQAFACKFLAREASTSGLSENDREDLAQRVKLCKESARTNLRDELIEKSQKIIPTP